MSYTEKLTIRRLIQSDLPPLPGTVVRITSMLHDMRISRNMIADAISLDPVLSSRVLRLANSPIYSLQREVTSLSAAIAAVGNRAIGDALMICGVGDSFGRKILSSPIGKNIWMHSLATAMISGDLCRLARIPGAEDVFSTGLLLDIGKLIFLRADPSFYIEVLRQAEIHGDICVMENAVYGFDHTDLGRAAAESWKLPANVCEMIRFHHRPKDLGEQRSLVSILHIADELVSLRQADEDIYDFVESDIVQEFGFTEFQFDHIWDGMIDRVHELLRIT